MTDVILFLLTVGYTSVIFTFGYFIGKTDK